MSTDKDKWDTDDSDPAIPSDSEVKSHDKGEKGEHMQHGGENVREKEKMKTHWTKAFPFSVFFIVGNEFCERFSYYGMRAVLVVFLTNQLDFGDDSATALFHAFIVLCYLLSLLGAIISDCFLGKYGTILSLSIVYAIGNIIVSGSAIPFHGVNGSKDANRALAFIGLAVIALGTGGIKPCVSAFGGDQFKEGQENSRRYFFSLFYFSCNAGSVISTLLTPILRDDIDCFNTGECFALAFGVPAVLMILAIVIFVIGTKFYVIVKPKKECAMLFLDVPACIVSAVYRRIKHGHIPEKTHWLQYASPKFTDQFVEDVRLALRVLLMFLPLPIFWALYDQQGSRWILQAVRMNGQLGSITIKPDQMQALNPILILVFIPFFDIIVYPIAAKFRLLKKPLQRMVVGMVFAGIAFVVAGFVQISIQNTDTSLSPGYAKVVVINSSPDMLYVNATCHVRNLSSAQSFSYSTSDLHTNHTLCVSANPSTNNPCMDTAYNFSLSSQHIHELIIAMGSDGKLNVTKIDDKETLPDGGKASFRVINSVPSESYVNFTLYSKRCNCSLDECDHEVHSEDILPFLNYSEVVEVDADQYYYCVRPSSNVVSHEVKLETGATYTIVLGEENEEYSGSTVELHAPNSVSLFLQVPMYFLITVGEVLFSISGLEFVYSQAPVSMKAVCQAAWLWTVAFGNFFVIIIAEGRIFENQAIEFFFFAACIVGVAVLFAIMAFFYEYVDLSAHNQLLINDDETSALILSHDKQQQSDSSIDDKGIESEF